MPWTVQYATSDGTATTSGADYTAASNATLTIAAGDTSGTITVTTGDDNTDEENETFTVTLSSPSSNAVLGSPSFATGTINDNDVEPTVTLVLASDSISESGGSTMVTATLNHPSSQPTTLTVMAMAVSPAVAADFTLTGTELSISAGQTSSTGTVTIAAVDNTVDAPDKTVTVSATASNSQGIGVPADVTLTIEDDDDTPSLSIAPASAQEGSNVVFTVTLSGTSSSDVTVRYDTSDGTATTSGADYTAASNATLTIAAGATSNTFTVATGNDSTDEENETFTVTLSMPSNATLSSQDSSATGTITDNDAEPTVTLVLSPDSISESGDSTMVTATLNHPSSQPTTLTVMAMAVSPAVAADFTRTGTALTIPAGQTMSTGTVTIAAMGNTVDAPNKTVTVSAMASNSQGIVSPADVTLTIEDDDDTPRLSIASASETEGSPVQFTVTLSSPSSSAVTVQYATSDGTATTSGADYTDTSGTLTFTVGNTTGTITVATGGDDTDEDNETFTVTLSNPSSNAALGSSRSATGTITDNDAEPNVSFVNASDSKFEGSVMRFEVSLSAASGKRVTVQYAISDGTATTNPSAVGGADYANIPAGIPGTLTIAAGNISNSILVNANDDSTDEPDETFTVTLTGASNAALGSPSEATGTIRDDDDPPNVSFASGSPSAKEDSPVPFTVNLSAASGKQVTVQYDTSIGASDTAEAGDFTPASGQTLTIVAGNTTGTITVNPVDDSTDEDDESFTVTLSTPSNAALGSSISATGTIEDNDEPPTVSITAGSSVVEGSPVSFTVSLDAVSEKTATVQYATGGRDGTATTDSNAVGGADYTAASGTLTFAPGTTTVADITVTTHNGRRNRRKNDETFMVTLSNPSNAITGPPATGTINDDDDPPMVSINGGAADEGEPITFEVTLSPISGKTVQVTYQYNEVGVATPAETSDFEPVLADGIGVLSRGTRRNRSR